MIIEQPEAFKTWLTAVLKPMCDADPAALAKYVLALVKKDKSEEDLQKLMISQLYVFLEDETESFVGLVLRTLESQDYITTPVIPNANPPNPIPIKPKEPTKPIVPPNELPNLSETINGSTSTSSTSLTLSSSTPTTTTTTTAQPIPTSNNNKVDNKIKDTTTTSSSTNKEYESRRDRDRKENDKRIRHRSTSRNRSRSRSWDRSKRSRSRDKDKRPRTWRNKSPPPRRFERRNRTRSPPTPRSRSRSRSPPPKHRRYRNRTPPLRSRSRSPLRNSGGPGGGGGVGGGGGGGGTPTQDSNHGDLDLRLTNSTQSIQSVVVQSKRRCRDFDEKGYCMRGEMCPYDHGIDPVVLEDAQLSSVLTYNPNQQQVGDVVVAPPQLLAAAAAAGGGGVPGGHLVMGPRGIQPEYNPQAPQIWSRTGFRGPRPMGMPRGPPLGFNPVSNMQRELIQVPVMDNNQSQPPDYQHHHHHHPMNMNVVGGQFKNLDHDSYNKKKAFDFNRLGPRSKNLQNCALELKKVPQGLNTITHLNDHFSKFGKIINIQVNYEGDPEAAIVTFSSHAEANAAYRSTEAVLNNRFIKVFWHNNNNNNNNNNNGGGAAADGKQENVPPRSVKDRLGAPTIVPPNTNKVLNLVQPRADENNFDDKEKLNNNNMKNSTTIINKEETKAQQAAAIKKGQELLAAKEKLKKNQDEKRKEVLKIKNNLRKRKQELLEKQLTQQKILIEKMEKLAPGPQRDLIMETIKKTQEAIEDIKKDLVQSSVKIAPQKKAKEDVQREILDAELDLITKQQEGGDTSELQKKFLELKAKAATSRVLRGRGRRFNPISRHLLTKNNLLDKGLNKTQSFQKHTVDHRPTKLLVSGYEADDQDSVLTHFQSFGEIVDYVLDETLPSITLNYKSRKEAEMALLKGKHFQDRTLSITWCTTLLQRQNSTSRKIVVSTAQQDEEEQLIEQVGEEHADEATNVATEIAEDQLLQDDEEEEEENEDRSWRR